MGRSSVLRPLSGVFLVFALVAPGFAQTDLLHLKKSDGSTVMKAQSNGAFLSIGDFDTGATPISGPGVRFLWDARRAALRSGQVTGTQWDQANLGSYSVALGYNTTASDFFSMAVNSGTTASGQYSFAGGDGATASGAKSFAFGEATVASGGGAVAFQQAVASGYDAFAQGYAVEASGDHSIALGMKATANGMRGSIVIGDYQEPSNNNLLTATAQNQFLVRARGGAIFSDTITSQAGGFKFPDGSIQTTAGTGEVGDTSITTAKLATSSVTSAKIANGTIVNADINAAAAIADTKLATISTAGKVANSATTATAADVASTIVARDAAGSFAANVVTANALAVTGGITLTADEDNALQINSTNGIISSGSVLNTGSPEVSALGAGSFMIWSPSRAAFRATRTDNGSNDYAGMGLGSVAFGHNTVAVGSNAVAMGRNTTANGVNSVTLGREASTTTSGSGSFVFGDDTTVEPLEADAANQFLVRASGGTKFFSNADLTAGVTLAVGGGAWTTVSDVARKHLFKDLSGEAVLAKIRAMPIQEWSYKSQASNIRHVGPTAQDFFAAFKLGESDKTITTSDIDGVNLLAAQALEKRTSVLQQEVDLLRTQNATLLRRLEQLEALVKTARETRP